MKFSGACRIIGLLVLCAVLSGCSAVKLAYNNLDDVAYWWLDSYVDFSDEQSLRVREDIRRLHGWHRKTELSQLAAVLKSMEQVAARDISPEQACAFVPVVRARLDALTDRAEGPVVTLAMSFTPEQLAHLARKFDRVNNDFRKDWIRPGEAAMKEKRLEQFVERSEMIYGELQDAQRDAVKAQLQNSLFDPKRVLTERKRRQQDLLDTLRKVTAPQVDIAQARALMRGYLQRTQEPPDPAYRTYQDVLIQEGCRLFSALHNSTTPAQREAAARRLRGYQQAFRELASQQ